MNSTGYMLAQLVTAATIGSIYALIAVGYTLGHGVVRQFNLAHGALYATGAYAAFILAVFCGIYGIAGAIAFPVLLAVAVVVGAAYGLVASRLLYRRLAAPAGFAPLVASVGLLMFLAEYLRLLQQSGTLFLRPLFGARFWLSRGGFPVVVTGSHLAVWATTAVALGGLGLWLARSRRGRELRAVADDPRMAALVGIATARMVGVAFALGAGLAGVAGALTVVRYGVVGPYMGVIVGLKALTAAVVGGVGSVRGAVLGGFLVAGLETGWAAWFPSDYREVVVFALLVAVLIFRPDGLLSRPMIERAPGPGGARW